MIISSTDALNLTESIHVVLMQTAKQQMIYINAAMERFGYAKEPGTKMGKHLLRCDFVETFQKMWRRHFKDSLFDAEDLDKILLHNMLISLQVKRYADDLHYIVIVWILW